MTTQSSFSSSGAYGAGQLEGWVVWINRCLEGLWLLAVALVPLAFLDRGYISSEAVISYVEVPKVALLRTLVALMTVLWLLEWSLRGRFILPSGLQQLRAGAKPRQWLTGVLGWLRDQPVRLVFLAVWFYLGTTLLSTMLSGSLSVSLWGEIPGQDGYSAYNLAAYVLLFAVIGTHLKTRPQLWRLLGAIVAMGTLVAAYSIFQHYGRDFLDLTEVTGGGAQQRVTAFMGNAIFASATMMMVIPVTLVAAVATIKAPYEVGATSGSQTAKLVALAGLWAIVLAIQLLGITFTFSRGPWFAAAIAITGFLGLTAFVTGWRPAGRAVLVLVLAAGLMVALLHGFGSVSILGIGQWFGAVIVLSGLAALTVTYYSWRFIGRGLVGLGVAAAIVGVVLMLPNFLESKGVTSAEESTRSADGDSTVSLAAERLSSVKDEVLSGVLGGRAKLWKVSWRLFKDRPWFEFDDLSLGWVRPLVGYGPDLFRFTYLLESPVQGTELVPLEPDHAHNFFIHHAVEQGALGFFSSVGLFVAVFTAGGYLLLRRRRQHSQFQNLVLVMVLVIIAGRALEMMVGVARISDLTILWALLAVFVALPVLGLADEAIPETPVAEPPPSRRNRRRNRVSPGTETSLFTGQLVWRLALVALLAGSIGVVTWVKSVNNVRAAVEIRGAIEQFQEGEFQSSLGSLDRAIQLAPDIPTYYNYRASLYRGYLLDSSVTPEEGCTQQERLPYRVCLAVRSLESNLSGVNASPFYFRSRLALADSAYNLQLTDQTAEFHENTLAMLPNSWKIRDDLANAYVEAGQPNAALEIARESIVITGDTHLSARAHTLLGIARLGLGLLDQSIDSMTRGLEINDVAPWVRRTQQSLGQAYAGLGRHGKAIEHLNQAAILGPEDPGTYIQRGQSYYALSQYPAAAADFELAIQLDAQSAIALAHSGRALTELGRFDAARKNLDEAIELDPSLALAYAFRGKLSADLGDFDQSLKDLDEALRLAPDLATAYFLQGEAFLALGQRDQAFASFGAAILRNPQDGEAYWHRGIAYAQTTEYSLAIQDYDQAIELNPSDPVAYNLRATAYREIGSYEAALTDFDAALRFEGKDPRIYKNRGETYYEMGATVGPRGGFAGDGGSSFSHRLTGEGGDPGNSMFRVVIPHSQLFISGSEVTITMEVPPTRGFSVDDMYIGHRAQAGNPWDFDGEQVRVTWDGGKDGFNIQADVPTVIATSDPARFLLDAGKDIVISWNAGTGGQGFKVAENPIPGLLWFVKRESQGAQEDAPSGLVSEAESRLRWICDVSVGKSLVGSALTPRSTATHPVSPQTVSDSFLKRAIADYNVALKSDPFFADAYSNRAIAYSALGEEAKAAQDIDAANRLRSGLSPVEGQP